MIILLLSMSLFSSFYPETAYGFHFFTGNKAHDSCPESEAVVARIYLR
jgi:hypothetical protein